jgi:molybdate transport system substrate-binding protein
MTALLRDHAGTPGVAVLETGGRMRVAGRSNARHGLAVVLLVTSAAFTACKEEGPDAPLYIGAAASLREPLEQIAQGFSEQNPGAAVQPVFGASNDLEAQLRAGAPMDVLLSADEAIPQALEADGLASSLRSFASNRLVVIATPEIAAQLKQPSDLVGPAVQRIAIPAAVVPIGHYARAWLAQTGLDQAVEPRVVQTEHVRATLAAVDSGEVDAAIVYATDARIAKSARVAFEIPDAQQPRIVYVSAISSNTQQPERATLFLDFLAGPEATGILRAAGFGPAGATPAP